MTWFDVMALCGQYLVPKGEGRRTLAHNEVPGRLGLSGKQHDRGTPMRTHLLSGMLGIVGVAFPLLANSALIATNIAGSDGSVSLINAGSPPQVAVISNISNLSVSDPTSPGAYIVHAGSNGTADAAISDKYFQGGGNVMFQGGTSTLGNSPTSSTFAVLLEVTQGGQPGIDAVTWSYTRFVGNSSYGLNIDGSGTVNQLSQMLEINGVPFEVAGTLLAGDKFAFTNSGETGGGFYAEVDINGDGALTNSLSIMAEMFGATTKQVFDYQTLTFHAWEIVNGNFVLGTFDGYFGAVTTNHVWPQGDVFDVADVVPIPPAVFLFGSALGVMGWLRRKAGV